jgi:putative nucleotidyltransferase with HDIG domain
LSALAPGDIVKNIRDLPSLSIIVMELLNSFENQDANLSTLAEKVARDQALAAKTLRLANSSFYGLSRRVTTIQQAITVLGFDCVRTLITAASMTGIFADDGSAGFDFKLFWRQSVGTALCAKHLAGATGLNQNYAFLCGLLHDIGKLVLVTRFPAQYRQALAHRALHDCFIGEAERAVLGTDHCVVGRALAEAWKFPAALQRAVAAHHAPEPSDLGELAALIHVADAVVHALDLAGDQQGLVPTVLDGAWKSLNLGAAEWQRVFRATEAEFEGTCHILAA